MIYKYLPPDEAISSLKSGSLLFRQASAFNDPFDMAFHFTSKLRRKHLEDLLLHGPKADPSRLAKLLALFPEEDRIVDVERVMSGQLPVAGKLRSKLERIEAEKRSLAEGMAESARVTCFSLEPSNVALWSHYAENHTGVCLGYDDVTAADPFFPGTTYHGAKVTYGDSVEINIFDNKATVAQNVTMALSHKLRVWDYEAEFRIIVPSFAPSTPSTVTLSFSRSRLTELRFGLRCAPLHRRGLLDALEEGGYEVEVSQMEKEGGALVARKGRDT